MNFYIEISLNKIDPIEAWLYLRDSGILSEEHLDFASAFVQFNLKNIVQLPQYAAVLKNSGIDGLELKGTPVAEEDLQSRNLELDANSIPYNYIPVEFAPVPEIDEYKEYGEDIYKLENGVCVIYKSIKQKPVEYLNELLSLYNKEIKRIKVLAKYENQFTQGTSAGIVISNESLNSEYTNYLNKISEINSIL